VVGTRQASAEGLQHARQLATELAHRDVTVLSGLAIGLQPLNSC
jgi:predicted Rossmann fold nucleotide-binding protein DprA/Smf involved in DNA uptake